MAFVLFQITPHIAKMRCMRCKNVEGNLANVRTATTEVRVPMCSTCVVEHETVTLLQTLSNPPSSTIPDTGTCSTLPESGSRKQSGQEERNGNHAKRCKSEEAVVDSRKANVQKLLLELYHWGGQKPISHRRVTKVPVRYHPERFTKSKAETLQKTLDIDLNVSLPVDEPEEVLIPPPPSLLDAEEPPSQAAAAWVCHEH